MKWILLAGAICSEVTASLAMKAALDNPAFIAVAAVGYIASFGFLAGTLRQGRRWVSPTESGRRSASRLPYCWPPCFLANHSSRS